MANFDQRGQKVTYQYNAAGNINFGAVQNQMALVDELEKLKREIATAKDAQAIDDEIATDAQYHLTKATQQAIKEQPDKHSVLAHINKAKELLRGATELGELVSAMVKAAEVVQRIF